MKMAWSLVAVFAVFLASTLSAQDADNEIAGLTPDQKITYTPAYQDLTFNLINSSGTKTVHLTTKQVETLASMLEKVPLLLKESMQTQIYDPKKDLLRISLPEDQTLNVSYTFLQAGNRKIQIAVAKQKDAFPVDLSYPAATNLSRELKKALKVMLVKPAAVAPTAPDPYSQNR